MRKYIKCNIGSWDDRQTTEGSLNLNSTKSIFLKKQLNKSVSVLLEDASTHTIWLFNDLSKTHCCRSLQTHHLHVICQLHKISLWLSPIQVARWTIWRLQRRWESGSHHHVWKVHVVWGQTVACCCANLTRRLGRGRCMQVVNHGCC